MKKLLITLPIIVLLAAGCQGRQNPIQTSEPVSSENQTVTPQNQPYEDYDLKTDSHGDTIYIDRNYLFQFTIPGKYKNFTVEQVNDGSRETVKDILFTFYKDNAKKDFLSAFTINIFTKAKGEELEKDSTRQISIDAKNDKYAYQINPDLGSHDSQLLEQISKSLKVQNNGK